MFKRLGAADQTDLLLDAIHTDQWQEAAWMIPHMKDINYFSERYNICPVGEATQLGNARILEMLLKAHAATNTNHEKQLQPLQLLLKAARNWDPERGQVYEEFSSTPAAYVGDYPRCAELLFAHGAQKGRVKDVWLPNPIKDPDDATPMMRAIAVHFRDADKVQGVHTNPHEVEPGKLVRFPKPPPSREGGGIV